MVVWLGYSVHGNETSSGEAAMLTAYYLVANRSAETAQWLQQAVVLFDPAQNPDGRDRAASWHNAYASSPASADPADRHVEPFPQGRTNHYFTDLNRDWLALTQQARDRRSPISTSGTPTSRSTSTRWARTAPTTSSRHRRACTAR